MTKRSYYIRTYKNDIGKDGNGLQMIEGFDSEAKAIDYRPIEMFDVLGTTVGKITVEFYDGHNIRRENLSVLVTLLLTCMGSKVSGEWSFDKSE